MRLTSALVFAAFFFCAIAAPADDWNRAYKVTGRVQMVVDADDGNVTVHSGSGDSVRMSVHSAGWRIGPDEIEVNGRQEGNRVELTLRKHRTGGIHFQTSLEIHITLPAASDLNIRTKDGNLDISGVKGTHRLHSGDGNADIRDVDGSVDLDTGDGNLRLDGRFDALSLRTGDGNIDAVARAGSKMTSAWTARTGDGNIDLRLPADFAADVDAHTGDGRVRSELPVSTSASNREKELRGKLNGGGQVLSLRTGDGDIDIRK